MAANFTPIKFYLDTKYGMEKRREDNARALAGVGATAGILSGLFQKKKYEEGVKDFFDSLGDGAIQQGEGALKEIDDEIAALESEIASLEGGI